LGITLSPLSGAINPGRSITPEDQRYLQNYEITAAVIGADKKVFGTYLQFKALDITNIGNWSCTDQG
jgi:hypothetical protein